MKVKKYICNPSGDRVEIAADKITCLESFRQVDDTWMRIAVEDAVKDGSLWSFLYYLYLYCIAGYMDKPDFADEKHDKDCEALFERLKDNIINTESLTLLRDMLRKCMSDFPEIPAELPERLKGCTVEEALGKYYELAIEALGCCGDSKYVSPYLTEFKNTLSGYDETTEAECEPVCSLPELSYRCCALAVLEDMDILESRWLNDDTRNGKTALYRHLQELSSMPGKFDAKSMYLLDLAAKCLEPFVAGQIHFTKPYEICYAPGYLAKKFQKMLDSFDEDLPEDTTGNERQKN